MPIKNAPVAGNDGGYEKKVPATKIVAGMVGHNQGGFETRVTQESGQH